MRLLWMFIFLATSNTIKQSYVEGFGTSDKNSFGPKLKGTVNTIEALECGDIIDCVDFYDQPAFDNPKILKDLKIDPSSFPSRFNKTRSHETKLIQTWHKYGECPKGTVPIKRTLENNAAIRRRNDNPNTREYAVVYQDFKKGNGGKANLNLWKPRVEASHEMSLSQLWITSGVGGPDANTVEAGWMVNPALYHDGLTRLFIYWTSDNYNKTGCYNTVCSGFVQKSSKLALGAALEPMSAYNGPVSDLVFNISRTREGDWFLVVGDEVLGYFPRSLFTRLGDGASQVSFGGEIVNLNLRYRHTTTQMGSGRFSGEGYRRSSFTSNIKVANEKFEWVEPNLRHVVTSPACYDLTFGPPRTHLGSHFYFGGPGLFGKCQ